MKEIPDALAAKVQCSLDATANAESLRKEATRLMHTVVFELLAAGLNQNDIASLLNVSRQRISQIVHQ
jgi:predicted XRE-type DNA-binding protein